MKRRKRTKQVDIVSLKKRNLVLCLPPFRLTPNWIKWRVACLPPLGWGSWFMFALHWAGKVVYGYFPLGDLVSGLLPTGGEGGLHDYPLLGGRVGFWVTSNWGSWFQGYSPLGERMGCMIAPCWGEGGFLGYFPLGKLV